MSLWVDDRAGSIDLMRHEPLLSTAEICRLDSGDAMILGNGPDGPLLVGVEVKSIYDLISSMRTGRLQATQLPALIATYDVRWLLIYGNYGPGPRGVLQIYSKGSAPRNYQFGSRPVPYGYVESFLCDVAALGVHVKNVSSPYAAAQWLGVLARWWNKPWSKHKGMRALDNSHAVGLMPGMDSATYFRACVASQLPCIGFERAMLAANHFKSVKEMVGASVQEWSQIPGIGKVIARTILSALNG